VNIFRFIMAMVFLVMSLVWQESADEHAKILATMYYLAAIVVFATITERKP
jgi:hypothetical protein